MPTRTDLASTEVTVPHARRRLPRSPLTLLLGLALAGTLVACNAQTSPAPSSPGSTHVASASPGSPSPGSPSAGSPSAEPTAAVGQTDTDWGRIWDELPPGFPTYPGSVPTETGAGPVSAELAVPADVEDVVTFLQAALEDARYSTEALSGPMEDGSRIIDSVGDDPACRVQTVVAPTGGTTTVTVRYGAECPFG